MTEPLYVPKDEKEEAKVSLVTGRTMPDTHCPVCGQVTELVTMDDGTGQWWHFIDDMMTTPACDPEETK